MSSATHHHNGGPAFPDPSRGAGYGLDREGMSLLDYFAAHAQPYPPAWFTPEPSDELKALHPAMPKAEAPTAAGAWGDYVAELYSYLIGHRSTQPDSDCFRVCAKGNKPDAVAAFECAVFAYRNELAAWTQRYDRERMIAWPYAWARMQLEQRGER